MATLTITAFNISDTKLTEIYKTAKQNHHGFNFQDLDIIFNIALRDKSLFPAIKLTGLSNANGYLLKWVKNYVDAQNTLPSKKIASPKGSCSDPAIKAIVQSSKSLSDVQATNGENIHNLFMSAENIQGNLLEEYIATKTRPYGWIWCCGNVIRAVDFCSTNGNTLLQIKNKSNTENSSSSAIRVGTTIQKWYRLGTQTKAGVKHPRYMWDGLNAIINTYASQDNNGSPCNMGEQDYITFLQGVTRNNTNLITDR